MTRGSEEHLAMNKFEAPTSGREARVRYLDADFQVVSPGQFVRCAVTGLPIALEDLKYWSVEKQEAYVDVMASYTAHVKTDAASQ